MDGNLSKFQPGFSLGLNRPRMNSRKRRLLLRSENTLDGCLFSYTNEYTNIRMVRIILMDTNRYRLTDNQKIDKFKFMIYLSQLSIKLLRQHQRRNQRVKYTPEKHEKEQHGDLDRVFENTLRDLNERYQATTPEERLRIFRKLGAEVSATVSPERTTDIGALLQEDMEEEARLEQWI